MGDEDGEFVWCKKDIRLSDTQSTKCTNYSKCQRTTCLGYHQSRCPYRSNRYKFITESAEYFCSQWCYCDFEIAKIEKLVEKRDKSYGKQILKENKANLTGIVH